MLHGLILRAQAPLMPTKAIMSAKRSTSTSRTIEHRNLQKSLFLSHTTTRGTASAAVPIPSLAESFDSKTGVLILTWNRPIKKNAITEEMYTRFSHVLGEAGQDDSVRAVILTGAPAVADSAGSYYSAGNDLSNFTKGLGSGRSINDLAADAAVLLRGFVDSWLTFNKLIIVAVNGPAVGIPVTTLPLADMAYASTTATFRTPFVPLGQAPEACSSVTFPRLMGHGPAAEMLLLGRQLTAAEAFERRLVCSVHAPDKLMAHVMAVAAAAARLPKGSMDTSKAMLRLGMNTKELREANERECALLRERWASQECQDAVMAFLMRKA